MKEIRVGVIGVGVMGELYIQFYTCIPSVKVIAVADINEERAKTIAERYGVENWYVDYKELLDKATLDAIDICTPDNLHREPVIDSTSRVEYILVEKPLASTLEDAEAITSAVRKTGAKLMIGFIERFHPPYVKAKEIVERNELGKILTVKATRLNTANTARRVANRDSIITFLAIHDIDLLLWYMGEISRIYAETDSFVFKKGIEDTSLILLRFKNDAIGCVHSCWAFSGVPFKANATLEIVGTEGILSINTLDESLRVISKNKGFQIPIGFNRSLALRQELEYFLDCIRRHITPVISSKDGMASLKVCLAAKRSSTEKRMVDFP